jgi:anti-sigma regulatory factor (Ser/Thr protein kinase)
MSDSENPEHCFDFGTTTTPPLAEVRNWLRGLLCSATAESRQDVELVTTELLTNAYEHAAGPFALRVMRPRGRSLVRLEVDDACPHLLPRSGRAASHDRRGRGMPMIEGVCSDWGVRLNTGRKTIWAEVPLVHDG